MAPFKVFISVFNLVELLQLCGRKMSYATDISWAEDRPGKHNLHFWQPLLLLILTLHSYATVTADVRQVKNPGLGLPEPEEVLVPCPDQ